jgi:hypothetical protein
MGKMYTFDNKLLCGSPELRIGDKVYSIDDRKNTVKKAMKLFSQKSESDDMEETSDEILKLAFGKQFKEIDAMDMSFAAYQELILVTIAAMTGQEVEDLKKDEDKGESFPD